MRPDIRNIKIKRVSAVIKLTTGSGNLFIINLSGLPYLVKESIANLAKIPEKYPTANIQICLSRPIGTQTGK